MLTGKCKEDFEKWLITEKPLDAHVEPTSLYYLPFSMQYGVYVDFFDSVNVELVVYVEVFDDREFYWTVIEDGKDNVDGWADTRTEARKKAIKKANEIYNKQK